MTDNKTKTDKQKNEKIKENNSVVKTSQKNDANEKSRENTNKENSYSDKRENNDVKEKPTNNQNKVHNQTGKKDNDGVFITEESASIKAKASDRDDKNTPNKDGKGSSKENPKVDEKKNSDGKGSSKENPKIEEKKINNDVKGSSKDNPKVEEKKEKQTEKSKNDNSNQIGKTAEEAYKKRGSTKELNTQEEGKKASLIDEEKESNLKDKIESRTKLDKNTKKDVKKDASYSNRRMLDNSDSMDLTLDLELSKNLDNTEFEKHLLRLNDSKIAEASIIDSECNNIIKDSWTLHEETSKFKVL